MSGSSSGVWDTVVEPDEAKRQHHQRVTAIARTAASMATRGSLESTLSVIAEEIHRIDGIVAAQLILAEGPERTLRMMGAAGFRRDPAFLTLLEACHLRGAPLATYAAIHERTQIIYHDRKRAMLADPAWEPLHAYIQQLDWNDFVATPFIPQGRTHGVINCYIEPGFQVTPPLAEFLLSMADQAALAVDYHELIERDRVRVREEERQRLARDLHDSVIQNVFTMGMYARALEAVGTRLGVQGESVTALAHEFRDLSQKVQRDLRGIVRALQPSLVAELGLQGALTELAAGARRRIGSDVELCVEGAFDEIEPEAADDLYYVVAEAVHNAIKHASPSRIRIDVVVSISGVADIVVSDDGVGFSPDSARVGYGLPSMRYRVARWGGALEIDAATPGGGTRVHAEFNAFRGRPALLQGGRYER